MKETRRFLRKILSAAMAIQLMAMTALPAFAVEASGESFQVDGFTYSVLTEPQEGDPGTVSLTNGRSKAADLEELSIAETVTNSDNGKSYIVTAIGEKALSGDVDGMNELQQVSIPASVTEIGEKAFSDQTKLQTLNFAEESKLRSIGNNAFDSTALKTVVLPDQVETLGNSVFSNCRSLTSVTLPASVTTLGTSLFSGCNYLKSIEVVQGGKSYASENGVLFNQDKTTLIKYPVAKTGAEYTVPATVTSIEGSAFEGVKNLVELTLPDGLLTIGRAAFQKMGDLETVNFGSKLQTIGYMAFYSCRSLGEVTIPATVTTIDGYAFDDCGNASFIAASEEQKTMLTKAGASADAITVQAPTVSEFVENGITYRVTGEATVQVGNGTDPMENVEGVITIPQTVNHDGKAYTVTAVAENAFWRVSKLTGLNLPETIVSIGAYSLDTTGLTTFEMPNSVQTMGRSAFSGCKGLSSVTLSNQLTEIPDGAFWGSGIRTIEIHEGVKTIGTKAFNSCANLQTVNLPASLETIKDSAFWSNEALREVTIAQDSRLQTIEENAFAFDAALKSINLPDTMKVIGDKAFSHCTPLKEIGLTTNNQLTTLGENAFNATAITSFHFAASLTNMGNRPLDDCTKLTEITVADGNSLFQSKDGVLLSKDGKTLMQYPAAKKGNAYTIPAGVTAIGEYAFEDVSRLNTLTVSEGVQTVGKGAFKDCSNLYSVTLADSVNSLGYLCFYNCPALETVQLPASLNALGRYTLYNCGAMETITVPAGVTTFSDQVFGDCPNLETVELQSTNVTSIAKDAFKGASSDVKITVTSEAIKAMVVESGIPAQQVTVQEGAVPPAPVPSEDVFTVNQVTYKVLTQPAGGQNGTVAVGNGEDGLSATGVVTIPAVVTNEGNSYTVVAVSSYALKGTNITELRLPDTVKVLEESALKDAPALETFTIPSGLESIGVNGVADCLKLKSINYAPNSSLTTLGDGAFAGNAELETIELPNTITEMGSHTMFWNNRLRTVTFQEGFALTELPEGTFMRDFLLEAVNGLPAQTKIGDQCFYHCENLKSFDLSNVTDLGEQAFYNCYALETISLGDELTVLDSGAFYGCRNLKSVKLGKGLTDLGSTSTSGEELPLGVFQNCTGLEEIELPASVRVFGRDCFQGCTSLKKITILSCELKEIGANAFYELHEDAKIYVVNEQMKNSLVNDALIDADSVVVMGDVPEKPTEEVLKLEAMGKGGIGCLSKATAVNKTGYFLVQITTASGANSIYTVPVPASGELPISYMDGCSITVWLTAEMPNLTVPTPNAGGAILGSASL